LTVDDQVTVQRWIAGFERFVWSKRLDLAAWPEIEEWAGKLKRKEAIAAAGLGTFDELRYVLNAAWRARIAVDETERDVDDPAELRAIAEAAETLMWELLDRRTDGGKPRRALQLGGQA
jgi:hypothetical protein